MATAKATASTPSKTTRRIFEFHGVLGNYRKNNRQLTLPRAMLLSPLFTFRRFTQALICFHFMLVGGLEPPDQSENEKKARTAFRNVRREVMLEDELFYEGLFPPDQPRPQTTSAPSTSLIPTTEFSEEPTDSNITIVEALGDDSVDNFDGGFDFFETTQAPSAATFDDSLFDDLTLLTEVPSTSPSEIAFLPVQILEDSEDPLEELGIEPSTFRDNFFDDANLDLSQNSSEVPSTSPTEIAFMPVPILEDPEDPLDELGVEPSNQPTNRKPPDNPTDGRVDFLNPTSSPTSVFNIIPSPTFAPTETPTRPPTFQPSKSPTPQPTEEPTLNPTFSPTLIPSDSPTGVPTREPTRSPTSRPTSSPTSGPTSRPTSIPTSIPTSRPTTLPTGTPTRRPTRAPTAAPTSAPSLDPTIAPTRAPTHQPTRQPTRKPTFRPTEKPTEEPSQDPTPSGTLEPSISHRPTPSPSISQEPTFFPTRRPTANPTIAPTLPFRSDDANGEMILSPFLSEILRGQLAIKWEKATERFVRRFLRSNPVEPPIVNPQVRANIERQFKRAYTEASAQNATGTTRRFLQEGNDDVSIISLVIQFDLIVEYNSNADNYDVNELVWSAFDSQEKLDKYISDLQAESVVFDPVREVQVDLDGYEPPPTQAPQPPPAKNVDIAVIIGASVGGVAFIILIVLLFLRRRSSKSVEEKGVTETQTTPTTTKNIKVSTEILVEPQDDVSTLGDPMFGQGGMIMGGIERDEMTATVGDDYDYTKHYRAARGPLSLSGTSNTRDRTISEDMSKMSSVQSVSMSKLGKMGENIFADDASFEEQFINPEERIDVVAPAGKLGMVIDTPNGGIPVVHAIKDTSVLVDQVRVGDRLLSVDGEDCTAMTAMQVSKLISLKSEKPARVLVFARSSTNTNPTE